jgi:hypothetical protein
MDKFRPMTKKETQEGLTPKESSFLSIAEFEEYKKRFNVGFIGDFIKLETNTIIEDEKKDDTPKLSNEWETLMKLGKINISS